MSNILWGIIACGALSILYAFITAQSVMSADAGNARMQEIAGAIREGAQAYLNRQYRTIAMVGAVICVIAYALLGVVANGVSAEDSNGTGYYKEYLSPSPAERPVTRTPLPTPKSDLVGV